MILLSRISFLYQDIDYDYLVSTNRIGTKFRNMYNNKEISNQFNVMFNVGSYSEDILKTLADSNLVNLDSIHTLSDNMINWKIQMIDVELNLIRKETEKLKPSELKRVVNNKSISLCDLKEDYIYHSSKYLKYLKKNLEEYQSNRENYDRLYRLIHDEKYAEEKTKILSNN